MKILIINAHPYDKSLCNALAYKYFEGAKEGGHEVKITNLRDLKFDPVLHGGYKEPMELEPDLKEQQELIKWCDHLVIVSPLWWANLPALLKGFIDRVFLPGFAFKFKEGSATWDKYMTGKSATVIYTMDAPFLFSFIATGDSFWRTIKDGILGFCGFKPVKRVVFDRVNSASEEKRTKWLDKVYKLGSKAK